MKIFLSLAFLAVPACVEGFVDFKGALDTERSTQKFDVPNAFRRPGYNYADTYRAETTSSVNVGGKEVKSYNDIKYENEMTVKDIGGGGQQLTMKTTRVSIFMETFGQEVRCDSDDQSEEANKNPMCGTVFDMLNSTLTMTVDEQGNIAEVSGVNSDSIAASVVGGNSENTEEAETKELEPSGDLQSQLLETSRALALVPVHSVSPGDTWPVHKDLGQLGFLDGVSKLLGYTDVSGDDCAVILMNGVFHMHLDALMQKMGLPAGTVVGDDTASTTTQALYYDIKTQLVRWSQTNTTLTLKMKNPVDGSIMTIPMNQTVTQESDIRSKIQTALGGADKEVDELSSPEMWLYILAGTCFLVAFVVMPKRGCKSKACVRNPDERGEEMSRLNSGN